MFSGPYLNLQMVFPGLGIPMLKIRQSWAIDNNGLNSPHLYVNVWPWPGPIFCLLLRVSSDYAQPITGQVTEVTCPVIGRAQPELTPSKRQKTGPGISELN